MNNSPLPQKEKLRTINILHPQNLSLSEWFKVMSEWQESWEKNKTHIFMWHCILQCFADRQSFLFLDRIRSFLIVFNNQFWSLIILMAIQIGSWSRSYNFDASKQRNLQKIFEHFEMSHTNMSIDIFLPHIK